MLSDSKLLPRKIKPGLPLSSSCAGKSAVFVPIFEEVPLRFICLSYVELNVAIIVGCVPSFAGYIRVFLSKLTLSITNINGNGSSIRSAKIDPEGGLNASRGELVRSGVAGTLNIVKHTPEDLNGKYFELENSGNAQPGQIIRTVTMTQEIKKDSFNNRRE